ncbi:MAG: TRAP transporter small permease subunit [Silicimonas sp.]|nr:TRAP transporter small permease subunit [Silicimonas sp.]
MAQDASDAVEEIIKISDPGEVGREEHTILDRIVVNVSNVIAWGLPLLMAVIVAQVILRGTGNNQAWMDDLQWWIYGFVLLAAFGYSIVTDSHVRVDVLHQHFSKERKARIEATAFGWMLLPFIVMMVDIMSHYAFASISSREGSDSPNGLHNLYILKSAMPILFVLAGLAAWAAFLRNLKRFGEDTWARRLIWAFPTFVFIVWRLVHYVAYWFIYLTNSEINPRRITREPIFEWLLYAAFAAVVVWLVLALLKRRGGNA